MTSLRPIPSMSASFYDHIEGGGHLSDLKAEEVNYSDCDTVCVDFLMCVSNDGCNSVALIPVITPSEESGNSKLVRLIVKDLQCTSLQVPTGWTEQNPLAKGIDTINLTENDITLRESEALVNLAQTIQSDTRKLQHLVNDSENRRRKFPNVTRYERKYQEHEVSFHLHNELRQGYYRLLQLRKDDIDEFEIVSQDDKIKHHFTSMFLRQEGVITAWSSAAKSIVQGHISQAQYNLGVAMQFIEDAGGEMSLKECQTSVAEITQTENAARISLTEDTLQALTEVMQGATIPLNAQAFLAYLRSISRANRKSEKRKAQRTKKTIQQDADTDVLGGLEVQVPTETNTYLDQTEGVNLESHKEPEHSISWHRKEKKQRAKEARERSEHEEGDLSRVSVQVSKKSHIHTDWNNEVNDLECKSAQPTSGRKKDKNNKIRGSKKSGRQEEVGNTLRVVDVEVNKGSPTCVDWADEVNDPKWKPQYPHSWGVDQKNHKADTASVNFGEVEEEDTLVTLGSHLSEKSHTHSNWADEVELDPNWIPRYPLSWGREQDDPSPAILGDHIKQVGEENSCRTLRGQAADNSHTRTSWAGEAKADSNWIPKFPPSWFQCL
jgi:hypothetical protein